MTSELVSACCSCISECDQPSKKNRYSVYRQYSFFSNAVGMSAAVEYSPEMGVNPAKTCFLCSFFHGLEHDVSSLNMAKCDSGLAGHMSFIKCADYSPAFSIVGITRQLG